MVAEYYIPEYSIRGKFGSGALIRAAAYDPAINVGKKHKAQLDLQRKNDEIQSGHENEKT